jgi:hypothetical protein
MVLFDRSGPHRWGVFCPLGLLSSLSSGGSGDGTDTGMASGVGGRLGCASGLASRTRSIDVVGSARLMGDACPCAGAEAMSSTLGFDGGTSATTVDMCAALVSCGVLVGVGVGILGGVGPVLLCCIGGIGDGSSGGGSVGSDISSSVSLGSGAGGAGVGAGAGIGAGAGVGAGVGRAVSPVLLGMGL